MLNCISQCIMKLVNVSCGMFRNKSPYQLNLCKNMRVLTFAYHCSVQFVIVSIVFVYFNANASGRKREIMKECVCKRSIYTLHFAAICSLTVGGGVRAKQ